MLCSRMAHSDRRHVIRTVGAGHRGSYFRQSGWPKDCTDEDFRLVRDRSLDVLSDPDGHWPDHSSKRLLRSCRGLGMFDSIPIQLMLTLSFSVGSMQTAKMSGSTCTTCGSSSPNLDPLSSTSPSSSSYELALLVPVFSRRPPVKQLTAARPTTNSARAAPERPPRS